MESPEKGEHPAPSDGHLEARVYGALMNGLRDLMRGRPDLDRAEILRQYPLRSRWQVEVLLDRLLEAEGAS